MVSIAPLCAKSSAFRPFLDLNRKIRFGACIPPRFQEQVVQAASQQSRLNNPFTIQLLSRRRSIFTSSPGEQVARTAWTIDCLAPLLITISSGVYVSPFSSACCSNASIWTVTWSGVNIRRVSRRMHRSKLLREGRLWVGILKEQLAIRHLQKHRLCRCQQGK